jgi:hypothetical protein
MLNRSHYEVYSQIQVIYSQHFFNLIRSAPGHVLVAFREHLPAPPRQFLCMAAVPGLGTMCWGDWVRFTAHVSRDGHRPCSRHTYGLRRFSAAWRKRLVGTSPVPSRPTHGLFQAPLCGLYG